MIPDALGRLVGFAAEIAFWVIYPRLQEAEFAQWQSAHPGVEPSNGWGALPWAFAGLALFVVMGIAIIFALTMIFPRLG